MPTKLMDELISASPNRRSFLKTIGAATAGVTALSMAGLSPAGAFIRNDSSAIIAAE